MKNTGLITAALVAGLTTAALAHNGATGIVKERMDAMVAMGKAVKQITPMMSGEAPYDAERLRAAARQIETHAGEDMTRLFPEGSGGMPSVAKDNIWEEWDAFERLAQELALYAKGLALAADNPPAPATPGTPDAGTMMGSSDMMGGSNMMGASEMMGGDTMMGGDSQTAKDLPIPEDLAELPVDQVFSKVSGTCAACHTRFRTKGN